MQACPNDRYGSNCDLFADDDDVCYLVNPDKLAAEQGHAAVQYVMNKFNLWWKCWALIGWWRFR